MTENNDYSYLLDIINLVDNNNKSDEQKIAINFEGDFLDNQQIGSYNNNLIYLISKDSNFDLALSPKCIIDKNTDNSIKQLISNNIDKTDINIQHFNKSSFFMPKQGHWISLNNWQYGSLPKTWLESINDYVDEVWVSSSYNKQCYIDSGINSEKIQVINYGVDPLVFNPNIDAEDLKIDKKIKFIYKGDLSWQSGFDKLLKAYTEEFCADEDICLIIITDESTHKDNINKIQEVTSLNDSPQIILIQKDLRDHDLARIYAYSNFMVSVQRVQNFCADTVNFMACGKVVISNDYGSVLDYCSESNSIPVKTERVYQSEHNIEGIETIDYPYWGEVDNNSLRVALRKAYDLDKLEYSILGKQASKTILDNFTYIKTGEISKGLMKNLLNKSIKRDVQEKFNNILLTGLNYLTKGDYDNSYIALKESWDIYPENESVNFYLANLMMAKSDYVQALEYNLNCLAVNPNQEDYNNLLGIILYKLGDYKLAESFLKKTLQLMPEHGGAKESLKAIETIRNSQFDNTDLINDKRLFLESLITENNSLDSYSLSVCILTKNEESTIEKAIRSVKDIADEIIILDTGSTDKTIDILKNHQVQLFTDIWHNDFSQARNEVMSHANCDWILMLDADECVEMELKDSIKPLLKNLSKNKVYQTKIVNFIDKNNIDEKIEHYVVRLLPNYKGIKYIRAIHEYPVNKDDSIIESEILNGLEIKHTGYLSNNVKEKDKIQRNRSILEKALSNDPQSIIDYFYLAENYKEENNYQKTIEYSEKVIELEEKFSQFESIIKMAKMNIIESMIVLKKYDQAFDKSEYFQKNLESRPDYWFLKGSIEYNRNNYNQAIKYEQKALSLRSQIIYPSIDIGAISWKPLSLIAESYVKLEDYKNASLYYRRALK